MKGVMRPQSSVAAIRRNLQSALRSGRLDDAEKALRRLQKEEPLAVQTRGLELELLLRQGRVAESRLLAEQLVEAFPTSARIHYLAGRAAYRNRAYERAVKHLRESLHISSHWKTRRWLGKALTQAGAFEQAEPLLLQVAEEHSIAARDLAWLYERMDRTARAVEVLERYLAMHSGDHFAARQLQRLRAQSMDPRELIGELETLHALGEAVPVDVLPETVKGLVEHGELERARQLASSVDATEHHHELTRAAWFCHRAHAPDLAYDLFVATFDHNRHSPKLLNALEADAFKAGRTDALIEVYQSRAEQQPNHLGRAKSLELRAYKL